MSSSASIQDPGGQPLTVSLITTILNEADQLPEFLESIRKQTLLPAEIIIVDGGSTDGSVTILEQWQARMPLTVLVHPGANISSGRNLAIERASGDIVAVTDAGVVLDPDWLRNLVAPFSQRLLEVDAVGGFFVPDSRTAFEEALAASTLPDVVEIAPEAVLPSSRSFAFRRSWFGAKVRYPEWLDYCEDLVFDLRLNRAGARFAFQPRALAHFRPRGTLTHFFNQYYRYARGDGLAGLFWKRHLIRYLTYLVVLPSFFFVRSWTWRSLVIIGGVAYMRQPAERLMRRQEPSLRTALPRALMAAGLRAVGDFAKMVGYPVGLWLRARKYGIRSDWRSIPEKPAIRKH